MTRAGGMRYFRDFPKQAHTHAHKQLSYTRHCDGSDKNMKMATVNSIQTWKGETTTNTLLAKK